MSDRSLPVTEREATLLQELLLQEVTRLNAGIARAGTDSRAADSMRETALIVGALEVKLNQVALQYRARTLAQQIVESDGGPGPDEALCDEFQEVMAALGYEQWFVEEDNGADIQDRTVGMASHFLNGKLTPNQP